MKQKETDLALEFLNRTNFNAISDIPKAIPQLQALCMIRCNDTNVFIRYGERKTCQMLKNNMLRSHENLLVLNFRSSFSF